MRKRSRSAGPASPVNPRPSLIQGGDRHAEVQTKALMLFAQHGFAQVSMRDLAASLGIGAGSLYHHIDSKEALLNELLEELYSQLISGARQIQQRSLAPGQYLNALVEAHLDLHGSMALHFRVAEFDLHYLGDEHRNGILSLRRHYEAYFVEALAGVNRGPDPALRDVATGIVLLLNQLPARLSASRLSRPELLSEMVERTLLGALSTLGHAKLDCTG